MAVYCPTRVLWGDTHLHTTNSLDARTLGVTLTVEDAYRFACGERVVSTRARWEPLYEVTQIKGDSEAHPFLSPADEFADFETCDRGNVSLETRKADDMLQYEYAREALKNGLKLERGSGTNPYQFGMVGSTDSHTALATAGESNFFGKMAADEPRAARCKWKTAPLLQPFWWAR